MARHDAALVVVGPEFCSGREEVLEVFDELGCCGDPDMSVRNASTTALLFTSETRVAFCSPSTCLLRDHHDNVLLSATPTQDFLSRNRFNIYRAESEECLFHVRKARWSSSKLHVYSANKNPKQDIPDYELNTNGFSRSMIIYKQGRVVAEVKYHCTLICCISEPEYTIITQPGVDQAFIVMLVSIKRWITRRNRNSQSHSSGT